MMLIISYLKITQVACKTYAHLCTYIDLRISQKNTHKYAHLNVKFKMICTIIAYTFIKIKGITIIYNMCIYCIPNIRIYRHIDKTSCQFPSKSKDKHATVFNKEKPTTKGVKNNNNERNDKGMRDRKAGITQDKKTANLKGVNAHDCHKHQEKYVDMYVCVYAYAMSMNLQYRVLYNKYVHVSMYVHMLYAFTYMCIFYVYVAWYKLIIS